MVDLLSQGLQIRFNGQEKVKTISGTIFTIIIIILTIVYAIIAIVDVAENRTISVSSGSGYLSENPVKGVVSPKQAPLQIAMSYNVNGVFSGCGTDTSIGGYDLLNTDWANYDHTCSQAMKDALKAEGLDPRDFVCFDYSKPDYKVPVMKIFHSSAPRINVTSCSLFMYPLKLCNLETIVDFNDFADPFKSSLVCFDNFVPIGSPLNMGVSAFYTMSTVILTTDSGTVGENIETLHANTIELNALTTDALTSYSVEMKMSDKYSYYKRSYNKITEALGRISGIWNLLLLVVTIVAARIILAEKSVKIVKYMNKNKGTENAEKLTLKDYVKGYLMCNKEARDKINRIKEDSAKFVRSRLDIVEGAR